MTPIDKIIAPAEILKIKNMSLREKLLLSLAFKFDGHGLYASNTELAELLDVKPSRISEILASLETKGRIEIKNRQSRHRVIHFRGKSKVNKELLSTKNGSRSALLSTSDESKEALLSTLDESTFDESRNKRNKGIRKRSRRKQFKPPTIKEVKEYAASNGDPNFDAKKFIKYYAEADWHDSKGNPVKNWKQKMLSVWLKPEPKPGDVDWLPTEAEAEERLKAAGIEYD